jgi:hypothetical protein
MRPTERNETEMTTYTQTDGREVVSYSTKETAQFIRAALKKAFPGVAFSVRIHLYSMGSSTNVRWTDGPTSPEVDRVVDAFSSKTFDGSDDSTHYHTQEVGGRTVSFSGYIHTSRNISPELRALAERRAALLGIDNVWEVLHTLRPNGVRVVLKRDYQPAPEPVAPVVSMEAWKQAEGVH